MDQQQGQTRPNMAGQEESMGSSTHRGTEAAGARPVANAKPIDWPAEVESTLQAMLYVPAQLASALLPEQTRNHLKAAGREAMLALYTLWRSLDKKASDQQPSRMRKHIEVE